MPNIVFYVVVKCARCKTEMFTRVENGEVFVIPCECYLNECTCKKEDNCPIHGVQSMWASGEV